MIRRFFCWLTDRIRRSASLFIAFALMLGSLAAQEDVPGVEIRTKNDRVYKGIKIPGSGEKELWIKNKRGRFVVQIANVAEEKAIRLPLDEVYTRGELYDRLFRSYSPLSAVDWDRFAAALWSR